MKDELGWAAFMVRSSRAICGHWALVCCAFAFCWWREASEVRQQKAAEPAQELTALLEFFIQSNGFNLYLWL